MPGRSDACAAGRRARRHSKPGGGGQVGRFLPILVELRPTSARSGKRWSDSGDFRQTMRRGRPFGEISCVFFFSSPAFLGAKCRGRVARSS